MTPAPLPYLPLPLPLPAPPPTQPADFSMDPSIVGGRWCRPPPPPTISHSPRCPLPGPPPPSALIHLPTPLPTHTLPHLPTPHPAPHLYTSGTEVWEIPLPDCSRCQWVVEAVLGCPPTPAPAPSLPSPFPAPPAPPAHPPTPHSEPVRDPPTWRTGGCLTIGTLVVVDRIVVVPTFPHTHGCVPQPLITVGQALPIYPGPHVAFGPHTPTPVAHFPHYIGVLVHFNSPSGD